MKSSSRIKIAATVASLLGSAMRPGAPSLSERAQSVPRLVRATRTGTYAGTSLRRLGLIGAALAYVASPIDLLPEAVLPILGAVDDAVVLSWAIRAFLEETDRFLAWETGQGLRVVPDAWGRTAITQESQWRAIGSRGPRATASGAAGAANGARNRSGAPSQLGATPSADVGGSTTGASTAGERVRSAATDYVLESVRKRLEG
ncbi:hypothetical protein N865_01985 [Intrasporangium oryzae NRRL B-24470]|uniref:DUF1232 domain-containing protein n=1 Tax=Intrasporangium oryzae NRRL B-24470 TaxID=1386089 RepID=W9GAW1_9MICO|nr:YkvA family protein [Intrasporangium oryzae]EWT03200.1 hypothetical protein N865_01985 [Intrasporangium oryzae NRRL B-24470]